MCPRKSTAQSKKSSSDANARLANGSGQPASSPAARNGQGTDAEDRTIAMDLVQGGQLAIGRERLAFALGVAIRHILDQPGRSPVVPDSDGSFETARGAEIEVETVGGRVQEEELDARRAKKRKIQETPEEKGFVKPPKRLRLRLEVRFHRKVDTHLASRELALCSRRPFIFTGSSICSTSLRLKRPEPRQPPRRYSREEFADLAAEYADLESIPMLQPKLKPSGCLDTCSESCGSDCSCLVNGLKCSQSYGCQCKYDSCQNVKRGPISLLEFVRRKLGEVEIANEKTKDWPAKEDSTIGSEGSFEDEEKDQDVEMSDAEADIDESISEADIAMVEPNLTIGSEESFGDEEMEIDEEVSSAEGDVNESISEANAAMVAPESPPFSPPIAPLPDVDFSTSSPPADDSQQADVTMRLSDGDDSSPDDSVGSDSSDSSDDDDMPTVDLSPDQFSPLLLQTLPASIDQQELDSCDDGKDLGGVALFVALLKIATIENQKESGAKVAVAHPDLFKDTVEMVENERAGAQAVQDVAPNVLQDNIVYGNGWTDLVIPMLVGGHHWAVAIVRRSLVSATIYDSLREPLCQELSIDVLKKLLGSIEKMDRADKTTSRFKIQYCRPSWRDVQTDSTSCGLFTICHVRRALQRQTRSAAQRAADPPINVVAERMDIWMELIRLVNHFELEDDAGRPWVHAPGTGQLRVGPAKTAVILRYSGRRF